jgi:hypothetical protein
MFGSFYSAMIRQKHKYIMRNVCYGRDLSFTINMIKYIKSPVIPNKGIINA